MWQWPKWDFAAYHYAATRIAAGNATLIYSRPVMDADLRAIGYPHYISSYLYPAPLAIAIVPLTYVSFRTATAIWLILSVLAAATAYACLCRVLFPERDSLNRKLLLGAAFLGIRAGQHDLALGNCNFIVLSMITLSMLSVRANAGTQVALAVAAWIKLKPAMLAVTFILRREWKSLALFMAAAGVIFLVAAAIVGVEPFIRYYTVTRGLTRGSMKIDNQSIYAVIGRLLQDSQSHIAPFHAPALLTPLFRTGCAAIWGATAVALWRGRSDRFFTYSLLLTAITLTSPISWTPHLVLMLLPVAWLLSFWGNAVDSDRRGFALEFLATAAIAVLLIFPVTLPGTYPVKGTFPVLLMSREFFGVLLVWIILLLKTKCVAAGA